MLGVGCKDGTSCAGGGMSGQDQHCWGREVRTGPVLLGGGRWEWDQYCWVLCKKLMQNMVRAFYVARWLPCRQMTTMYVNKRLFWARWLPCYQTATMYSRFFFKLFFFQVANLSPDGC
jgi:hypothetical protein